MPNVEGGHANADERVGLLSYLQDAARVAWATHHEQHELEDKALALAVASVKDAQRALRELFDAQFDALRAALQVEHAEFEQRGMEYNDATHAWQISHQREHELIQRAVDRASDALSVRLEGMNEFRAQLDRMVATLVTLDVLDVRLASVAQRLDKTDDIVEKRLTNLEQALTRTEGKSSGYSAFWGYIVGGAGFLAALIVVTRDLLVR